MVELTKEQADYLETFDGDKSQAIYYISSWGWGNYLKNGLGEVFEKEEERPFTIDEKEKMITALINGYEVIESEPKFKFCNFSDRSETIPLYYAGKTKELTGNEKFALEVKKDSEEYKALLTLGFIRE